MAWATDPFYASRIGFFYAFTIGSFFSVFHFVYIATTKAFKDKDKFYFILVASLTTSFFSVAGVIVIVALYVAVVPITNSIETASEGVSTIYSGAVVLISALLAYRIGWYYFGDPFSVSDALQKALKDIDKHPFEVCNKWKKLTEEERLTEVMKAILKSKDLCEKLDIPPHQTQNTGEK